MRKVLPLLSFIGQEKPWGKNRRASVLRKLLGMYERFGPPSVLWTVSLDDVHNTPSIRMAFPSASNSGFPSFASKCEIKSWEEGGTAQEVKVMLGALRRGEEFVVNGKPVSLSEKAACTASLRGSLPRPSIYVSSRTCTFGGVLFFPFPNCPREPLSLFFLNLKHKKTPKIPFFNLSHTTPYVPTRGAVVVCVHCKPVRAAGSAL
jgi:hypothetical protein